MSRNIQQIPLEAVQLPLPHEQSVRRGNYYAGARPPANAAFIGAVGIFQAEGAIYWASRHRLADLAPSDRALFLGTYDQALGASRRSPAQSKEDPVHTELERIVLDAVVGRKSLEAHDLLGVLAVYRSQEAVNAGIWISGSAMLDSVAAVRGFEVGAIENWVSRLGPTPRAAFDLVHAETKDLRPLVSRITQTALAGLLPAADVLATALPSSDEVYTLGAAPNNVVQLAIAPSTAAA